MNDVVWWKSLKIRVTLFTLIVFVGSIWSLAIYVSYALREDMERVMGEQQLSTVSFVAAEVNGSLQERLSALKVVAERASPEIMANRASAQAFLQAHPVLLTLFNGGSFITGRDGTAIADFPVVPGRVGTNYMDRESVSVPLKEGKTVIGRPNMGKTLNAPIFSIVVPILDRQGAVIGAIVSTINLGLPNFLDRIAGGHYGRSGGYLLVDSKNRVIVTATDKSQVMTKLPEAGINPAIDRFVAGFSGSTVHKNPLGKEVLSSRVGIPVAGWGVVATIPTAEAFAPVEDMQRRVMMATLLLTALSGALTWWWQKRQIQPMVDTVRTLAIRSKLQTQLQPLLVKSQDEIGALIGGFNTLIEQVNERDSKLRESESRFRAMADSAPVLIWISGLDKLCFWFNKVWLDFTGRAMEQELGNGWAQGVHPEDFDQCLTTYVSAFDARQGFEMEYRLRRFDGEYRWLIDTGVPRFDEQGRFSGYIGSCIDITDRKRIEHGLIRESEKNLALLHNASDGVAIMDGNANVIEVSESFCAMLGYSREEVMGMNVSRWDCGFSSQEELMAAFQQQFAHQTRSQFQTRHRRKDGSVYDAEVSGCPIGLDGTKVLFNSARDITQRKRDEEKLQLAASVFSHAREGIMITTADGTIVEVNDTFTHFTGFSRDEVLGKNPRLLSSGRQGKDFYAAMWRDLMETGHWYGEIWNRRKDGEVYAAMQTVSAVRDPQGNTLQYVALFSDITPIKTHQTQLEYVAHYDALTRLPNRVLLSDRLHQAMAQALRRKQRLVVAFLDLDGFKAINDKNGHEVGDQVLISVAANMKHALRDGDTLARLGGDEFVVVLPDLMNFEATAPMLSRLLDATAQPMQIGELKVQVSASLGVTFFPQAQEVNADQLLRQADQAMYQAKLAGKNRYHVFDAELDRSVRGHHESLERIRQALGANEFVLQYQPKVNMRTGHVIGAEALIRWQHPIRGLLMPAEFLPIIEDHALAVDLGEWVLDNALMQVEQWRACGLNLEVSVNVGARQLQQADFAERLTDILAAHPAIRPSQLQLEILETSALADLVLTSKVIEACRVLGVTFSLDDFGTGYSSLTYLKRLPVVQLKIDQSFVHDMLDDADDLAILDGVIGLAKAFNREVIAEGVESVECGNVLLQLGCELAQGYGIARPMPGTEVPAWCLSWRPDPAWVKVRPVSREYLQRLFASVAHRKSANAAEELDLR